MHIPFYVTVSSDVYHSAVSYIHSYNIAVTVTHRSVRVRPGVGHRKGSFAAVVEVKILVLKGSAINRLSTGSVAVCIVASLAHESGNDAVKAGSLEALSLALEAELLEILDGLWDGRSVQAHLDATGVFAVNGNIKIYRLGDFGFGVSSSEQTGEEIKVQLGVRIRNRSPSGPGRRCRWRSKGSDQPGKGEYEGSSKEERSRKHGEVV